LTTTFSFSISFSY